MIERRRLPRLRAGSWLGPKLPFTGRTPWPRRLDTPLRTFLRTETGSAAMLLLATAAALVWTNVDAASYERVWRTRLALAVGHAGVSHDLHYRLSSGLMTVFFFVVGLEARREFDLRPASPCRSAHSCSPSPSSTTSSRYL